MHLKHFENISNSNINLSFVFKIENFKSHLGQILNNNTSMYGYIPHENLLLIERKYRRDKLDPLVNLKIINFYYFKDLNDPDIYYIISSLEYEFLIDYLENTKNEFRKIYDKNGVKIYPNRNENEIEIDQNKKHYLIKYLLGSEFKINDFLELNKYLFSNSIDFNFNYIYNLFKYEFMINNYDFPKIIRFQIYFNDNDNDNFLENIIDIFHIDRNLLNNELIDLILTLKDSHQNGGLRKNRYLFKINYNQNKRIYKIKYN